MENDPANNDGQGGCKIAHEAEGCCCGGDVTGGDEGLKGDKRSLEVWTDADAGNDFEDDDPGP